MTEIGSRPMVPTCRRLVHGGSVAAGRCSTPSFSTVRPSTDMWRHTGGEIALLPPQQSQQLLQHRIGVVSEIGPWNMACVSLPRS
mmetsp:Transcript_70305/g.135727  ORF Transcript_70305/g.135727 Transcript_70305/m.135727 type:complete len:85 (+) Transcript_70305:1640-1894(+)